MSDNGMKRKMRDLVDPVRRLHPRMYVGKPGKKSGRRYLKRYPDSWYEDGHLASRPLYAFYALGTYSEYLLALARERGPGAEAEAAAENLFDVVRSRVSNVLTNYPIDGRFRGKTLDTMRAAASALCDEARRVRELICSCKGRCRCPACGGELSRSDAELLEDLLRDASESGLIPTSSKLYRITR